MGIYWYSKQLFKDFEKAYIRIRREVLYKIFIEFGTPMKVVKLIKIFLKESCSKVRIGKNLSDAFPIQKSLKQGDALSTFLSNIALEFAIRIVQENQERMELNEHIRSCLC